jgi:hypothetical protein
MHSRAESRALADPDFIKEEAAELALHALFARQIGLRPVFGLF